MQITGSTLRVAALSTAVGFAAFGLVMGSFAASPPDTDVGSAGLALGDDTARAVERVSYRQDVTRIGDIVIVDGAPRDEITDERIGSIWNIVDSTWPMYLRDELAQVSVVEETSRGLVGVVHPSATGGWILSLDVADLDDRELLQETIVHELSHVVTLDRDGFVFGEVDDCDGAQIGLGCAATGSVLQQFSDRFWPGDVASANTADFVNEYATSAAHEDLAETFTALVFEWPVAGASVDAKRTMIQADPGLAELALQLQALLVAG